MPSTTIEANPQVMMPAYNPIKWIIDNSNKNEPGFRYIFTIYPAGSGNKIAQYKVLPAYITGFGEQDISKLMQSKVTFSSYVLTAGSNAEIAYDGIYFYDIAFGYEFIENVNYTNALQDNSGNVRITATAHGFVAGDQIIITQADDGVANPAVEGLHTVISATANNFTINVLFSTVTDVTINGEVTYADLRKTIVDDDLVETDYEAFNGAIGIVSNNGAFDYNTYSGINVGTKFVSSANQDITAFGYAAHVTPSQKFFLNLRVYNTVDYNVDFYDTATSNIIHSYSFVASADVLQSLSVGPDTDAALSVDYYVIVTGDNGMDTEPYYFTIDNRCEIYEQQLIYLDRMGSFQSFAFQLKTYEKGQITREQYNEFIPGTIYDGEWIGLTLQTGFRTYNTNVTKSIDLNTNWMSESDGVRFQELLTSPQVYYISFSPYYFEQACIVETSSFEVFRQRNKNLIKQSVTIRLAQQDSING